MRLTLEKSIEDTVGRLQSIDVPNPTLRRNQRSAVDDDFAEAGRHLRKLALWERIFKSGLVVGTVATQSAETSGNVLLTTVAGRPTIPVRFEETVPSDSEPRPERARHQTTPTVLHFDATFDYVTRDVMNGRRNVAEVITTNGVEPDMLKAKDLVEIDFRHVPPLTVEEFNRAQVSN